MPLSVSTPTNSHIPRLYIYLTLHLEFTKTSNNKKFSKYIFEICISAGTLSSRKGVSHDGPFRGRKVHYEDSGGFQISIQIRREGDKYVIIRQWCFRCSAVCDA